MKNLDYLEVYDMGTDEMAGHAKKDIVSAIEQFNAELVEMGGSELQYRASCTKKVLAGVLGNITHHLYYIESREAEKTWTKKEAIEKIRHYDNVASLAMEAETAKDMARALLEADFETGTTDLEALRTEIELYAEACVCDIDKEYPGLVIATL